MYSLIELQEKYDSVSTHINLKDRIPVAVCDEAFIYRNCKNGWEKVVTWTTEDFSPNVLRSLK